MSLSSKKDDAAMMMRSERNSQKKREKGCRIDFLYVDDVRKMRAAEDY
eukprot:gene5182-3728_t